MTNPVDRFLKSIPKVVKEEEAIKVYQGLVGAKDEWERPFNTDGVFLKTLYESKEVLRPNDSAAVLAQICYYLRLFKLICVYKGRLHSMPLRVAGIAKNAAFVTEVYSLDRYFSSNEYDWTRPASSPDPNLVKALAAERVFIHDMSKPEGVQAFLDALKATASQVKQFITRDNFDRIFLVWKWKFGQDLNPQDSALAFLYDLQNMKYVNEANGSILFGPPKGPMIEARCSIDEYKNFWQTYSLPPENKELKAIVAAKDRIVAIQTRRETGEFFTPVDIAALSYGMILNALDLPPDDRRISAEWNLWDPACGTGNLTLLCPPVPGQLFMSTINPQDVAAVKQSGQNPEALVFAYDFLNQTDDELPAEIRKKLVPGSKWIFFFNPPFAAGTGGNILSDDGEVRKDMSDTRIGDEMEREKLEHACQNLYSQFMYRIVKMTEKYGLQAYVGFYSMVTYATGPGYTKFRELLGTAFTPVDAFVCHCSEFESAKGSWPVLFSLWKRKEGADVRDQSKGARAGQDRRDGMHRDESLQARPKAAVRVGRKA